MTVMSILDKILEFKKKEVAETEKACPLAKLQNMAEQFKPRGFREKLESSSFPAIIAEIKKASPSKGMIRADLDPLEAAKSYAQNGAACLSVLTEEKFFSGSLSYLRDIRQALPYIPLLRKDFIFCEYQLWEGLAYGADAVLLIVKALSPGDLKSLYLKATDLGLDVLIEIHDREEGKILAAIINSVGNLSNLLVGINNRNLSTFDVSLDVSEDLIAFLDLEIAPDKQVFFVSESGIFNAEDLLQLKQAKANAFLIGESLVKTGECGANLQALISEAKKTIK
ncbi:MAG: indole-3-glycerol phosphate synthase TrpC [Deltaproteobacteria bacterium]|nr:indole-3-glycerol phosphate synthase TrpC [Deltaproteobacteria bacterium]